MSNRLVSVAPWGGFRVSPETFGDAARRRWRSARPTAVTDPHPAITASVENGNFNITLYLNSLMLSGDGTWEQMAEVHAWYAGLNELPGPTRLLVTDMAQSVKAEIGPDMTGAEVLAALEPVDPDSDYFERLPWA